jgi:hypothetical protein
LRPLRLRVKYNMNLQNEISNLKHNALQNKKAYQKITQQLKKLKPYDVDELFQTQHEQVFAEIDCLQCANCCKTTPALVTNEDINRIAKHLQLSSKEFITKYVIKDDDGDTILHKTPCTFLGNDNKCTIYECATVCLQRLSAYQQKKNESNFRFDGKKHGNLSCSSTYT